MKEILLMMYLITSITLIAMLSSFSTTFLTMKKCNRVLFQSMRSGAVHHNGAQCCMRDFYFFFHIVPLLQKFKKNICCEGYSKACSRKIWLWSLSKITSNFFQLQFFSQSLFFSFVEQPHQSLKRIFFLSKSVKPFSRKNAF